MRLGMKKLHLILSIAVVAILSISIVAIGFWPKQSTSETIPKEPTRMWGYLEVAINDTDYAHDTTISLLYSDNHLSSIDEYHPLLQDHVFRSGNREILKTLNYTMVWYDSTSITYVVKMHYVCLECPFDHWDTHSVTINHKGVGHLEFKIRGGL